MTLAELVEARCADQPELVPDVPKNHEGVRVSGRWLACRARRPEAKHRLYCFPHSGGSAGEFVVWVDRAVAGAWASYDLFFEPPIGSAAPNWWISDVPIERAANPSASDLGSIRLPDAARLRARGEG